MITSAVDLYDKLLSATDDRARARILAEAFEALEERFPNLADAATRRDLSETELRLTKEIEQVRGEIKDTELKLTKEIEQVRGEIKGTELKLTREIEQLRAELGMRIAEAKASTIRWVAGLLFAQFAGLVWVILRTAGI